ncbi:MAG TPA: hypothetical protein VKW70_04525 [Terriglobia bacterium]|nr:hypothetical protein [Terriglobia bacterium]
MRCGRIQKLLEEKGEAGLSPTDRQHVEACPDCRLYARDWSMLAQGLKFIAQEPAPEPSWGFSARLLRRLNEEGGSGILHPEFYENAGRRVIFATLVLVFTLLLAMALPASGPVRHKPNVDTYWPQPEVLATRNAPVYVSSFPPVPAWVEVKPVSYHWR